MFYKTPSFLEGCCFKLSFLLINPSQQLIFPKGKTMAVKTFFEIDQTV